MATTYDQYPTPPPTGSPKDHDNSNYHPDSSQHRPAQETYFDQTISYSTPGSPSQNHPRWKAPPQTSSTQIHTAPQPQPGQYDYLPPRRKSSPIQSQQKPYPHDQYYNPAASSSTIRPPQRRSSPGVSPNTSQSPRRTPPLPQRPLHFSPINPVPTPYNVSRPQPRPGLLKRMLNKLKAWARGFVKWCRNNPIKAGLLTAIPILAGAAMFKVLSSAVKVLGTAGIVIMEGMGGGRTPGNWMGEMKDKAKEVKNDAKEQAGEEAEEWGYGMDHFKGFAGSKGSPIEGFLKVMQMAVYVLRFPDYTSQY